MFNIWVKSSKGIRMNGNVWETVFSWHIVFACDSEQEAQEEAGKLNLTKESPAVKVLPVGDWSLCGPC